MTLVVGGSASGKSAFAEDLALSLPKPHIYVATMENDGDEARARIRHHQEQRDGKGFVVAERPSQVAYAGQENATILLEDVGNLVANLLFTPEGGIANPKNTVNRITKDIANLCLTSGNVVVVSNEVGCGNVPDSPATRAYIAVLGAVNCNLARMAQRVFVVSMGIPTQIKGAARADLPQAHDDPSAPAANGALS